MSDEQREQRNAIFSAPKSQVDPRVPVLSATERMKAEFGLDIPCETVPLPSAGVTYPKTSPLSNKESLDIAPMTAREEDILTSRALLKKGTVITELIRSCLIDKTIDPSELLSGDRNALMVAIRITGYGADYEAEIDCTGCSEKSKVNFNLGELPIKRLEIEPSETNSELFEFRLPYTKKLVKFRFLTCRDEENIATMQERQKKLGLSSESSVTTNLMHSIVSIDGIEDRTKISNFVRMMPARDSLALRNYIRDNEPGIIMKQEVTCPKCGYSEEVAMGINATFLWPNSAK